MIGHKRIPSREGGIEIVVTELAERMVAAGHTVHAYNRMGGHVSGEQYTQTDRSCKEYKGIRLITVPTFQNRSLNAFVYAVLATLRALFGNYDVIHFHAEGPCSMIWLPRLFGIRTVATIHGLDWSRAKWGGFATRYLLFGERMAVKYADEIIVLSENIQNYFRETYGRDTVFIPNGISAPVVQEGAAHIRQRWGLSKDSYLLFLSRLVPEKGVEYLLEAYRSIPSSHRLVVAGGASHTDEYAQKLMELGKQDERVLFTGFVQGRELEELFSNCLVFCLPSDIEGMPIVLLEAMSYGNCCLVSDIPENLGVVGDAAASFRKSSVEDLRQKLQALLDDPAQITQYRNEASAYVLTRFNWDDVAQQHLAMYMGTRKRASA